ncbi:16S rRNA (guanine(527)-N(7))-methyltransferase RsmG [Sphingobium nicotianae]|uniref:Ribosomal RNA small subunit methyltransferase G n=1 Tax=Sphingobium nicotianae TaxID=2782607 RepID=A0A9X1ISP7_9SPHN|nr:16S rRNA (guanine(527)-N(7))-methyltransferase RsmG [Sphingobium nicotianae]MBT2188577.1 16S rRNA (guanine(527)-N(7))-methyltransferase RsmG [Sphingobium nicotianae]
MTEEEAQAWLAKQGWWDSEGGDRLRRFVELVLDEADRQNLISGSSRPHIWARHIADSAQLVRLAPPPRADADWIDLGTGAGFPGIVIACLRDSPMKLVEARPLRVAFLQRCVDELGLRHAEVIGGKVENSRFREPAAVISARAYAPLDRLLMTARHLSDEKTVWLLPKGRQGEKELEIIRRDWQAVFHVEQSITDPESAIVTINQLVRRPSSFSYAPHGGRSNSSRVRKPS